jgi:hypothetical protein
MIGPDKCMHLLHLLGFSAGEVAFQRPDDSWQWQVDASRDGHTILAKAPTQRHAWALALRLAGRLIRQGVLVVALVLVGGCETSAPDQPVPMDSVTAQQMLPMTLGDPPDPNEWHAKH